MKEYIRYLNSLHTYHAQNPNAYAEKNVTNRFYEKTMVKVPVCDFITKQLKEEVPHILILTGHAGDGKTSIMSQVVKEFGNELNMKEPFTEFLHEGKEYRCIKDFSELSDDKKLETLKNAVAYPKQGKYVFMVSNTGPLIHTFGRLFADSNESEAAKMDLINAMDKNNGKIQEIKGYRISVINVAAIDNTFFPTEYLSKILDNSLWEECSDCVKKDYCHIYMNQRLIGENKSQVNRFIDMYYIWQAEYGNRLTLRSMTEQLAYMITGAMECDEITPRELHKMLFPNLFFGYYGNTRNANAQDILSIHMADETGLHRKRIQSDEELLIRKNYTDLFGQTVQNIIFEAEKTLDVLNYGWAEELRRFYYFLNIRTDKETIQRDIEDIFSKQFFSYLNIRNGEDRLARSQKVLIEKALFMLYLGSSNTEKEIPVTLSKDSGIAQTVQLVIGTLPTNKIVVDVEQDSGINNKRFKLILKIKYSGLKFVVTLPMLDYFEELKNGIISTNVDPQLSHGIDSLKAKLAEYVQEETEEDVLELMVLDNKGYVSLRISIDNDRLLLS